eukprot:m.355921 g.355921  ORF g.355921 m.355921 type:complete len:76 (+) comp17388_c0_seq1:385-612(+)
MWSPIRPHFPDFDGPEKDFDAASAFIAGLYHREKAEGQDLYTHFTTATSTENIQHVFVAVKRTLLRRYLEELGLH